PPRPLIPFDALQQTLVAGDGVTPFPPALRCTFGPWNSLGQPPHHCASLSRPLRRAAQQLHSLWIDHSHRRQERFEPWQPEWCRHPRRATHRTASALEIELDEKVRTPRLADRHAK